MEKHVKDYESNSSRVRYTSFVLLYFLAFRPFTVERSAYWNLLVALF